MRLADSFTNGVHAAEVGYKLLYSFGKSERDIERYKEGKGVIKTFDGLLIKGLFCFQPVSIFGLTDQLEQLKANPLIIKAAPKIIAVSDGKTILAYDLREAHAKLDDIVESCYPGYPFASDEARLECLFKLYEKMTAVKK